MRLVLSVLSVLSAGCVTEKAAIRAQAASTLDRCLRSWVDRDQCYRDMEAFCHWKGLERDCGTGERETRVVRW